MRLDWQCRRCLHQAPERDWKLPSCPRCGSESLRLVEVAARDWWPLAIWCALVVAGVAFWWAVSQVVA